MKIDIDKSRCLGSGQCQLYAPTVFDQDEDNALVTLLDSVPPEEYHDAVRDAATLCPGAVITVHEN